MKIIDTNEEVEVKEDPSVDLIELLTNFQEKHRNVFMIQIEGITFIYRSLGRGEYKQLLLEEDLSEFEKQDIICEACVLWPANFDFEDCSAGLPSILYKKILKNSFLDSVDSRRNVLTYYRQEMFDLENQIACIINEAFPNLDVEDIEQWDTEKTMKYLSRAEWKLQNLRGMPFVDSQDIYESFYPAPPAEVEEEEVQAPVQQEQPAAPAKQEGVSKSGKPKLTPEKIAEMKELQAKFPEINFFGDTILNEGMTGMSDSFDSTTPGLRPGF